MRSPRRVLSQDCTGRRGLARDERPARRDSEPDYIGACAPMSTKPKTLLIVDDDEGMRDTLTAILRRDYAGLTAPTGGAGLETLAKVDVDLMLLDVRLPNIGGLDVLKITKEQYPRIEAIVISAVSEVETAVQAIKQGAYHFITKDFE